MGKNYYRVRVSGLGKDDVAIFYENEDGTADLQYGWATYTTKMHQTLGDAVDEFASSVRKKNAGKQVSMGEPVKISREEAASLAPSRGD
jgi:hypothetical protein